MHCGSFVSLLFILAFFGRSQAVEKYIYVSSACDPQDESGTREKPFCRLDTAIESWVPAVGISVNLMIPPGDTVYTRGVPLAAQHISIRSSTSKSSFNLKCGCAGCGSFGSLDVEGGFFDWRFMLSDANISTFLLPGETEEDCEFKLNVHSSTRVSHDIVLFKRVEMAGVAVEAQAYTVEVEDSLWELSQQASVAALQALADFKIMRSTVTMHGSGTLVAGHAAMTVTDSVITRSVVGEAPILTLEAFEGAESSLVLSNATFSGAHWNGTDLDTAIQAIGDSACIAADGLTIASMVRGVHVVGGDRIELNKTSIVGVLTGVQVEPTAGQAGSAAVVVSQARVDGVGVGVSVTASSLSLWDSSMRACALGCVLSYAFTDVQRCNFSDSTGYSAGAIAVYNVGNKDAGLNVRESWFSRCGSQANAGGIMCATAVCLVQASRFDSCFAPNGGSVSAEPGFWRAQPTVLTLDGCTFVNSTAFSGSGGAVQMHDVQSPRLVVNGCAFVNCSAIIDGGAVSSNAALTSIGRSTFSGCYARLGGGIFAGRLAVRDSLFDWCSSDEGGGFISDGGTTENVTFTNCTSVLAGGCVSCSSTVTFTAVNFYDSESNVGGSVRCEDECNFDGCVIDGSIGVTGAGVYVCTGVSYMQNTVFRQVSGGSALSTGGSLITMHNITFEDSSSPTGAAVECDSGSRCLLKDSVFRRLDALQGGAVFCIHESTCAIQGCEFDSCVAWAAGGAVDCEGEAVCAISDSSFARCAANHGGVASAVDGGVLSMSNVSVADPQAFDRGGAVYCERSQCSAHAVRVHNAESANVGGAVSCVDGSTCHLDALQVFGARARRGGGVNAVYSSLVLENSMLADCVADDNGGGVMVSNGLFRLSNTTVLRGRGSNGGGAGAVASEVEIRDSAFRDCTAIANGGGLYQRSCNSTLAGVRLDTCAAALGGGLYSSDDRTSVTGGAWTANTAAAGAGAYFYSTIADASDVVVSGNTASAQGGGLAVVSGVAAVLVGVAFRNNSAAVYGGAAYLEIPSPTTVTKLLNTSFSGNTAGQHADDYMWVLTGDMRKSFFSVPETQRSCAGAGPVVTLAGAPDEAPPAALGAGSQPVTLGLACGGDGGALATSCGAAALAAGRNLSLGTLPVHSCILWACDCHDNVFELPDQNEAVIIIPFDGDIAFRQRRESRNGEPAGTVQYSIQLSVKDDATVAHSGVLTVGVPDWTPPHGYTNFTLATRRCDVGQESKQDVVRGAYYYCDWCPLGMVSLTSAGTCTRCGQTGQLCGGDECECEGGSSLRVQEGFWRASPFSEVVRPCVSERGCVGASWNAEQNVSAQPSQCVNGTHGPLCGVCDEGYGKNGDDCGLCEGSVASHQLSLLSSGIGNLLPFLFFVRSSSRERSAMDVLTTILTTYVQYMTFVSDFRVDWNIKALKGAFSAADGVMSAGLSGTHLGCLVDNDQIVYLRFAVFVLLPVPFALLLVFLFVHNRLPFCHKTSSEPRMVEMRVVQTQLKWKEEEAAEAQKQRQRQHARAFARTGVGRIVTTTLVAILFVFFPSMAKSIIRVMHCTDVELCDNLASCLQGKVTKLLVADLSLECHQKEHAWIFFCGVSCFFLYCVFVPVIGFHFLKKKKDLRHPALSFLSSGLREKHAYWEIAILIPKLLLSITVTFIYVPVFQTLFCAIIMGALLYVESSVRPYADMANNRARGSLVFAVLITYVFAFFMALVRIAPFPAEVSNVFLTADNVSAAGAVCVIVVNGAALFYAVQLLVKQVWGRRYQAESKVWAALYALGIRVGNTQEATFTTRADKPETVIVHNPILSLSRSRSGRALNKA